MHSLSHLFWVCEETTAFDLIPNERQRNHRKEEREEGNLERDIQKNTAAGKKGLRRECSDGDGGMSRFKRG